MRQKCLNKIDLVKRHTWRIFSIQAWIMSERERKTERACVSQCHWLLFHDNKADIDFQCVRQKTDFIIEQVFLQSTTTCRRVSLNFTVSLTKCFLEWLRQVTQRVWMKTRTTSWKARWPSSSRTPSTGPRTSSASSSRRGFSSSRKRGFDLAER